MTEREYDGLLDVLQDAFNGDGAGLRWIEPDEMPAAANDNSAEWPLTPFPEGWYASP